MMRPRFLATLAAAAVVGSAVIVPAMPAVADSDAFQFSRDGVTWTSAAPGIFDTQPTLVPGGGQTSTWHVRNVHEGAARISVALVDVELSSETAGEVFVLSLADGRGGRFAETPVGEIRDCTPLIPQRVIAPGDSIALAVTVGMPSTVDGSLGEGESVTFGLALSLTDPVVPELEGCAEAPQVVPLTPAPPRPSSGPGRVGAGAATLAAVEPAPIERPQPPRGEARPGPVTEWVSCDLRAFASAISMSVGGASITCADVFASDGAALALLGLFLLIAILWLLIFWRRRQRDEEEERIEGSPA